MHTQPKELLATALAALAITAVVGCASNHQQNEVVAQVQGFSPITKATLEHWTRVEFHLLYEYVPRRPTPKGAIPDPPSYTDCIAYLQHTTPATKTSTTSQLKAKCQHRYQELRASTLNKLIAWDWRIGKAHALGIHPTTTDIHHQLASVLKAKTLYGTNLTQYLKYSEQTMPDILYRTEIQYYENALTNNITHFLTTLPKTLTAKQKQAAYTTYLNTHPNLTTKHWITKTTCHKQYIVSACKQYTGTETPPDSEN